MHSTKLFICILLSIFFFHCSQPKPLRSAKDIKKSFKKIERKKGEKRNSEIERQLEASLFEQRNISQYSAYYIGQSLREVSKRKPWRMSPEEWKESKDELLNHLIRLYTINSDFNMKNVCLRALSHGKNEEVFDFYLKVLSSKESHSSSKIVALSQIRKFILSKVDVDRSKLKGILLEILGEKMPQKIYALDNLLLLELSEAEKATMKTKLVHGGMEYSDLLIESRLEKYLGENFE